MLNFIVARAPTVQGAALRPKNSSIHPDRNLLMRPTSYLHVPGLKACPGGLPPAAAGDYCTASIKTTVTCLYKMAVARPGLAG